VGHAVAVDFRNLSLIMSASQPTGPDGTCKIDYYLTLELSLVRTSGDLGGRDQRTGHQQATRQGGSPSSIRGADAARKLAEVEPLMKEILESLPLALDDCR
jgi:hypothetical protein